MKLINFGMIILLGAIWGASFIFIFIVTPVFGPAMAMWLRVTFAAVLLLLIAAAKGCFPDLRRHAFQYLLMGTFNAALPFVSFSIAETMISASMTSIINSTTPLSTAAVAAVFLRERITVIRICGMALGFLGVFVLVGGSPLSFSGNTLLGVAIAGLAASSYSIASVFATRNMSGRKPLESAAGQFVGASAVLFIPAMLTFPSTPPTSDAIWALVALVLLSTIVGYLLYFSLINALGATRTALYTYFIPCFGSLWAAIFLGEKLTLLMIVGGAIILFSVFLVLHKPAKSAKVESASSTPDVSSNPATQKPGVAVAESQLDCGCSKPAKESGSS